MKYSKSDLKQLADRNLTAEAIDRQLANFQKGFGFVRLAAPATIDNGIIRIAPEEEEHLIETYEAARENASILKMVPASGSATRMFQELFAFAGTYTGSHEEYLDFTRQKEPGTMYYFFDKLDELPFYGRLADILWKDGKDIRKMLDKHEYNDILKYILTKKGLNYGNTPKGLVDFHIYRDFVRTAFDEHIVEGALYAEAQGKARIHFTVSEEHLPLFQARLKKITKVFEKAFGVKYDVTFSLQQPSTDTVCIDEDGNLLRDEDGAILFRPGGHGALIHNLNTLDADIIFIKNIDNVIPDRSKGDTVRYKKMLAGILLDVQQKVFDFLHTLDNNPTGEQLLEIESYLPSIGYREATPGIQATEARIRHLRDLLDRPIRICGMVRNEGEPGGGPFWVSTPDGSERLMIVESAQANLSEPAQQAIFARSTHFNPVDLVCSTKNHRGEPFDLTRFVAADQGFITRKSYQGKNIRVQELPGLWNGAMANWITVFVEVPLTTFTPVKTVFDLFRFEHRNVLKK